MKLYLDGLLNDSDPSTVYDDGSTASMTIGAINRAGTISFFWPGSIDEVKIYDYARTPAQIALEYSKGAPIAHYKMDECEGTTIYNTAPNFNNTSPGNNGTLTIGASDEDTVGTCSTSSTAWGSGATGKRNASISLDGSDDYIDIGTITSAPTNASEGSITAWIKLTDTVSSNTILASADEATTTYYFHFRVSSDKLEIAQRSNDTQDQITGSTSLASGIWYHVALVSDGSAYSLYVNGKPENLTTSTGSNTGDWFADTSNRDNMHIGVLERTSNLYYFKGQIDDVKVFNYPLTPYQVRSEYGAGAVSFE
jgi:hypothetical protein